MSDPLKRFIDENRDAFDSESPGHQLLARVGNQLSGPAKVNKIFVVRLLPWAAAIAGLILLSTIFYFTIQKKPDGAVAETEPDNIEEATGIPDPVYAKQAWHFRELIDLKQTELKLVSREQPELYNRFAYDINRLDSAYRVLKTTLDQNPNTEVLLEAMISNLQMQAELLNRQLLIIKEIKQKNKNHEKISV